MKRFIGAAFAISLLSGCAGMQPNKYQFMQQSRYAELRTEMEAVVARTEPKPSTGDLVYLCFAYSKIRAYDKLFPCIDRLQGNIDAGQTNLSWFDMSSVPAELRSLAALEMGDYDKAIAQAKIAYGIIKSGHPYGQLEVYALSLLSLSHALAGHQAEAGKVLAELEANDDWSGRQDKFIGIARTRMALRDWAGAIKAVEDDDKANSGFYALTNLITGASLSGESIFAYWELPKQFIRAHAQMESGDAAAARPLVTALLARPGIEQNGDLYWMLLDDAGRIAEADQDRSGAIAFYQKAADAIEAQRASIASEAGRIGFVGDKQAVYFRLALALMDNARSQEAFAAAERGKARALVDLLASRHAPVALRADPNSERLLSELRTAETAEAEIDPSLPPQQRAARRAAAADMAGALKRQAPELAALTVGTSLDGPAVQARLAADETLVEYYGGESGLIAFVVSRHAFAARRLDGTRLTALVQAYRGKAEYPADPAGPRTEAATLYDRLVRPLDDLITTPRLTIVPHGVLHYLPFAALFDGNRYLVESRSLRMLPSASVLAYLRGARGASSTLILGNPDLGDARYDLAYAQAEAEAIHARLRGSILLERGQATETAVRAMAGRYTRLHFASHGMFDADHPLSSRLLLAPDGSNDGMLTVADLYGLQLNADLVTLSACQTALGKVATGDDVVGLTRGFLYAGSRSIVASLWSVDDQATMDLMVRFYAELDKGAPPRDALRRAQLAVRAAKPHPFYWAAFELTGGG